MKVIRNPAGQPAMQALAPQERHQAAGNDSHCHFACLCGTLKAVSTMVCKVIRVTIQMKLALRRSKMCINPVYVWTERGPDITVGAITHKARRG